MWAVQIVGSLNKVFQQFKTHWGYALHTLNYRQVHGLWQSVSWTAAVVKTPLVSPDGEDSIEISDILITAEKKAGGSITIHFEDAAANTKDVVKSTVADGVLNVASNFGGKVQGWQGAVLYYTVVGTFTGSILITFVKHGKENSIAYNQMKKSSGW